MSSNYLDLHTRTSKAMTDTITPAPVPMIRIRISTDFQASTKRIEPSVTVELVCPADMSVDYQELVAQAKVSRAVANHEFVDALEKAEQAIAPIRPAAGEKS